MKINQFIEIVGTHNSLKGLQIDVERGIKLQYSFEKPIGLHDSQKKNTNQLT